MAADVHAETGRLAITVSGGTRPRPARYVTSASTAHRGSSCTRRTADGFESGDILRTPTARTSAGKGDVDGIALVVDYPIEAPQPAQHVHVLWTDLIAASDAGTARRLLRDPAIRGDGPALAVRLDEAGTAGFTVTIGQLLAEKALWIPSLDVYVTAGDRPVPFANHLASLESRKGQRMLERLRSEPEADATPSTPRVGRHGAPVVRNPQPARSRPHRRAHLGQRHPQVRHRPRRRRVE